MWDDDDYDPTAQIDSRVADAVAVFGIADEPNNDLDPVEKPAEKPKPKSKPSKHLTSSSINKAHKDLTMAEIIELQQRGEMEMFADVLGTELEKDNSLNDDKNGTVTADTSKQFEELEKDIKEKEAAVKPQKTQQKSAKQNKKKLDEAVYDDYVDDEYDNYDDKFANY